jgi:hypothetical protein
VRRDGAWESLEKDGEGDRRVGMAEHAHWPEWAAHETEETRQNKNTGLLLEVCEGWARSEASGHWWRRLVGLEECDDSTPVRCLMKR